MHLRVEKKFDRASLRDGPDGAFFEPSDTEHGPIQSLFGGVTPRRIDRVPHGVVAVDLLRTLFYCRRTMIHERDRARHATDSHQAAPGALPALPIGVVAMDGSGSGEVLER